MKAVPILSIHSRERMVHKARLEVAEALGKIWEQYDLTMAEFVNILCGELQIAAKYQTRIDRHGRSDKPGGLA